MAKKSDQQKSGKQKSGTSARSTTDVLVGDLSKQVKKLTKQLKVAERERDALSAKLDKQKAKAKAAVRAVEKQIRKELKKTQAAVAPAAEKAAAAVLDHAPAPAPAATSDGPDDSWTVTRLRAEARSQNVPGYSRKNKDQLLSALR